MKRLYKRNQSLSKLTTFHIGGVAKYYCLAKTKYELVRAVAFAEKNKLKICILGGGSNVLFKDDGFDGLVIHVVNKKIVFKGNIVDVDAGYKWDALVTEAIKRKLSGIESLSGIPGTAGGAPVQNIGAYGQELRDVFVSLKAYDIKTNKLVEFTKNKCRFGYRDSIFKDKKYKHRFVIWKIRLKLSKENTTNIEYESLKNYLQEHKIHNPSLIEIRNAVLTLRKNNHIDPKISGNAGSFFKNPIVSKRKLNSLLSQFANMPYYKLPGNRYKLFSGWLIETAGWKGKRYKNAMVSPKHALIIINPENKATAAEVKKLSQKIVCAVSDKFGIKLEREVNFID